jgi:hypothetical protein
MLARISCDACRLSALWTNDPLGFLDTVCRHYGECRARLSAEAWSSRVDLAKEQTVAADLVARLSGDPGETEG